MSWKSVYYENAGSNNWMLQEANYKITEKDIVNKLDQGFRLVNEGITFLNVFKDL